jgi:phytoene/squalene synthetase
VEAVRDPESFVWAILPHVARSFAPCMLLLPRDLARICAVAYLQCRILDTYEDSGAGLAERLAALSSFAARFRDGGPSGSLPALPERGGPLREADLVLFRGAGHVDQVHLGLPPGPRRFVGELVQRMAGAMSEAAVARELSGGILAGPDRLDHYCDGVLGEPIRFVLRLRRWRLRHALELEPEMVRLSADAAVFIQLGNVTRDLEEDLRRGLAYDEPLRPWLGRDAASEPEAAAAVSRARGRLLDRALAAAPAFGALVRDPRLRGDPLLRGAALLMLLFTERHYRGMAARLGRCAPVRPALGPLLATVLLGAFLAPCAGWSVARSMRRLRVLASAGAPA